MGKKSRRNGRHGEKKEKLKRVRDEKQGGKLLRGRDYLE